MQHESIEQKSEFVDARYVTKACQNSLMESEFEQLIFDLWSSPRGRLINQIEFVFTTYYIGRQAYSLYNHEI